VDPSARRTVIRGELPERAWPRLPARSPYQAEATLLPQKLHTSYRSGQKVASIAFWPKCCKSDTMTSEWGGGVGWRSGVEEWGGGHNVP
jgi:hypothetical protein